MIENSISVQNLDAGFFSSFHHPAFRPTGIEIDSKCIRGHYILSRDFLMVKKLLKAKEMK